MTEFDIPIPEIPQNETDGDLENKKQSIADQYRSLTDESRETSPSDEELSDYYVQISALEVSDMLDICEIVGDNFDEFRDLFKSASQANIRELQREFESKLEGNKIRDTIYEDFDEHGIRYKGHYRDVFVSPEYIEPEGSNELREKYGSMAQKALDKLKHLGIITEDQSSAVTNIWNQAVVLDQQGIENLLDQASAFDAMAQKQFDILDNFGFDSDKLSKMKANMALSSYKYAAIEKGSPGFVLKRQSYMEIFDDEGKPLEEVLFINKTYLDSNDLKLDERAFAYEETAHLISNLNQYPEVNRPWVEEMLAKATVMSLFDQDEMPQGEDMKMLGYQEYMTVYHVIESHSKTNGLLRRILLEQYDRNSDEYKRLVESVNTFDMIGKLVDMGMTVEDSLVYIKKLSESESEMKLND